MATQKITPDFAEIENRLNSLFDRLEVMYPRRKNKLEAMFLDLFHGCDFGYVADAFYKADKEHTKYYDQQRRCVDCGIQTYTQAHEFYLVCDKVWKQTGLGKNGGMLCIGCLEHRLGRELVRADFVANDINLNRTQTRSPRLQARLKSGAGQLTLPEQGLENYQKPDCCPDCGEPLSEHDHHSTVN
jgi:hypothetical protein